MKDRDKLTLQTVLVAVIVIVAVVYALFIRPNYYHFNGGKITLEPVYSENLGKDPYTLYSYKDAIYMSSKNGFKKVSSDLEDLWNKTFYLVNPLFIAEEGYMAVVDIGGKEVFVFDEDGLIMNVKVDYPILLADISSTGALVLVEDKESNHLIQLYNRKGILAAERLTNFKTDGYPIGIDLSSTGEKMVTSYLSVESGVMQSMITFFTFGQEVEKDPQNILGAFILEGTLAPEVKFLDDERIVAISDNSLNFYNIGGNPKIVAKIEATHQINQVLFNEDRVIVHYGKLLGSASAKDEDMAGKVVVYNSEGKKIDAYMIQENVRHLVGTGDDYYVITTDAIERHNSKKMVWRATIQKDVKDIFKVNKDQYIMVLQQGYELVKIKDI